MYLNKPILVFVMKKITSKILKLEPVTFVFLFFLVPFISMIITGIMTFIGVFANFEFVFPLFLISLTIVGILYFGWVWGVVYHIEEKDVSNKLYFKISYGILFSYALILFMLNLELDITKKPILLDNYIWDIIEIVSGIYSLIVFASYSYVSYFVGKKIQLLQKDNRISEFLYMAAVWCFPIGIPLLQTKLLNRKTIFETIIKI